VWWQALLAIAGGLALVYLVLLVVLWRYSRANPDAVTMREALRLLPDLLRLLRRLAADRTVSLPVRLQLVLLMGYLASPIDLVPDFIPVLGYADDVLLVAIVLRSVLRHTGPDALGRHWPGTPRPAADRAARRPASRSLTEHAVSGAPWPTGLPALCAIDPDHLRWADNFPAVEY